MVTVSAVTENHGNLRDHGIHHQPWFYRGNFTAVKLPGTVLEITSHSCRQQIAIKGRGIGSLQTLRGDEVTEGKCAVIWATAL